VCFLWVIGQAPKVAYKDGAPHGHKPQLNQAPESPAWFLFIHLMSTY